MKSRLDKIIEAEERVVSNDLRTFPFKYGYVASSTTKYNSEYFGGEITQTQVTTSLHKCLGQSSVSIKESYLKKCLIANRIAGYIGLIPLILIVIFNFYGFFQASSDYEFGVFGRIIFTIILSCFISFFVLLIAYYIVFFPIYSFIGLFFIKSVGLNIARDTIIDRDIYGQTYPLDTIFSASELRNHIVYYFELKKLKEIRLYTSVIAAMKAENIDVSKLTHYSYNFFDK